MQPIGTPAFRPTADCIWNSFRNSAKRHLLLTGDRGTGKTTLMQALFPEPCPGLTTWAEHQKAVWMQDALSGRCGQVGIYDETLTGTENKMMPCPAGFHAVGIPTVRQYEEGTGKWFSIDEIRKLVEQ